MKTSYGEIKDELFELLKHEEVFKAMPEAKSPEECYEIAKPYIGTLSFAEFQSSMIVAKTILDEQEAGTLSEADLDMIAGGSTLESLGAALLMATPFAALLGAMF